MRKFNTTPPPRPLQYSLLLQVPTRADLLSRGIPPLQYERGNAEQDTEKPPRGLGSSVKGMCSGSLEAETTSHSPLQLSLSQAWGRGHGLGSQSLSGCVSLGKDHSSLFPRTGTLECQQHLVAVVHSTNLYTSYVPGTGIYQGTKQMKGLAYVELAFYREEPNG